MSEEPSRRRIRFAAPKTPGFSTLSARSADLQSRFKEMIDQMGEHTERITATLARGREVQARVDKALKDAARRAKERRK